MTTSLNSLSKQKIRTLQRRDLPLVKYSMTAIVMIVLLLSLLSDRAHAQAPAPAPVAAGANFAEHQQKELSHIAQHLQVLQTLQSCVQAATDHAGIKACNATAKASEHPGH